MRWKGKGQKNMSAVGAQMIVFVVIFRRHHFPSFLLNCHSPNSWFMSNGAKKE